MALQVPTQGETPPRGAPVLAVSSLAVSPQGDNSFVVMTNFIVTPGQKQGTCPEVNTLASSSGLSFCNSGDCGGITVERLFLTLGGVVKARAWPPVIVPDSCVLYEDLFC